MPLQRPHVDSTGAWHFFDGDLQTWLVKDDGKSFTSGQRFKKGSPHTGAGRKSTATPPYHVHRFQTETFAVQSGILAYLIDGRTGTLKAGETVNIPPWRPHTFWSDEASGEDLVVHITVKGGDNPGFDETFVHNFYGYLSSVTLAGRPPNPFQMLRLLDHADVILAGIPVTISNWINIIFGRWIGGYLLRLPTSFKEFAD
ncbi:RmlC-like jelly roll fold [Ceraceosorus bombacis]|uniref:RmlC-like jelly roll fold n=1 Tax=Ceraceosorus bombacis TaxID=401625 RepID=A0A0P1BCX4_9BASI|nr:RmlC-like jelly roll fold [Ceraceosorus bombacis]